ncbi:uncharacterized protein VTP21DRAFT_11574 [Calcarisporiella thermophila]|uniref:uncharacterized protein n=1 Tax=Calcarisporiella thermophila TaxID=911321 RepID=UPI0037431DBD
MAPPLKGIRVLELAGLAPVPFAGMILSDFGADVIRVDRVGTTNVDTLCRNKKSIAVNLKQPAGVEVVKQLAKRVDILLDPFRPGIMEKLNLGPDALCAINPRLIYARLTGYGQEGSLSQAAGHDINYISMSGVLSMMGRRGERPYFPINLLADFAGGGLLCVCGILMALYERQQSGLGQVIDNSMTNGVAYLGTFLYNLKKFGFEFQEERGANLLDGGAPFYEVYKTSDEKFLSVGALEPQFYSELIKGMGLSSLVNLSTQNDPSTWPELQRLFADTFASQPLEHWLKVFNGTDACVTPVVDFTACNYPSPAPKLSRSPAIEPQIEDTSVFLEVGQHTMEILREIGYSPKQLQRMLAENAIAGSEIINSKL